MHNAYSIGDIIHYKGSLFIVVDENTYDNLSESGGAEKDQEITVRGISAKTCSILEHVFVIRDVFSVPRLIKKVGKGKVVISYLISDIEIS